MNFEQEIYNQNNARRMNILKGFSDFSEDLLQKSEEGSELEKGHMDFSNQRVYADNSVNRKLNRVGQKYGGRNVEDEKGVDEKDNSEEEGGENKPTPPQETQPNEQGQYSTEQLTEFAAQAEDWQLQEFLDNAKKSGDNSEYMQAQVNIAETELNRRRGGETSGEESVDSNNEKNFEQQESDYQENMSNADENGLPDFNDIEAVKNFLNENPQIKDRALAIVNDDIFIPMKDAIKLANAETKSSGEAMKTVEAAKQALDEVYNKLSGAHTEGGDSNDTRDFLNDYDEVKTSNFSIGQKIKFKDADGEEKEGVVADNNEYIKNGVSDGIGIEIDGEIIGVPTGEINGGEFENMPEYFGKKVTRVSPWGDDKIIIEHPDGSERTLKPGDKHYDELVKFKTDTNRFDDNTNSENQSSNDKERTNEANKNSNQYGVDKVSQKSLQNIYDSGEHYEDAEDFRESVRYYNNEDSGVSDLSDKEIETWFDLYNSDKRKY